MTNLELLLEGLYRIIVNVLESAPVFVLISAPEESFSLENRISLLFFITYRGVLNPSELERHTSNQSVHVRESIRNNTKSLGEVMRLTKGKSQSEALTLFALLLAAQERVTAAVGLIDPSLASISVSNYL